VRFDDWRWRFEAALNREATLERLEAAGMASSGIGGRYTVGMRLRALGRETEARQAFRDAFLLPDKKMWHYLSRQALGARQE
jgi:hypothetical protein